MNNRNNTAIAKTDFDLDRGCGKARVRGDLEFYGDSAKIETNGEALVLDTSGVVSYRINRGIGCVSLEAVTDDGYILICRGTMEYLDNFCRCQRSMNAYLKQRSCETAAAETADSEAKCGSASDSAASTAACGDADSVGAGRICPKCRRPLPPGSTQQSAV